MLAHKKAGRAWCARPAPKVTGEPEGSQTQPADPMAAASLIKEIQEHIKF
ncbi:MAG: hypothetical protein MI862_05460 [Desulfobacterales bacterium]|nr:hypothetical protein [Desulfobacterales bacterium]